MDSIILRTVFLILSATILFACDTSGNDGDDPLPEDPVEVANPNTLIPIEKIRIHKFGNADEVSIFPIQGKNLGFLSGNGEYSLKLSAHPEYFKTPDKEGVEFSVLNFPSTPDTIWLYQNNKLKNTFLLKEGVDQYGVSYQYSLTNKYVDFPKAVRELQQRKLFATN